tara:strand:- start:1450 stop:2295 length:846 start_codon:yes stop_codon:yes gene_type:complete
MHEIVGIVGSGQMGSAIGEISVSAGHNVYFYDKSQDQLNKSSKKLFNNLAKESSKKQLSKEKKESLLSRLHFSTSIASIDRCDIIIECVMEDEKVKSGSYNEIDQVRKNNSIIATNTSSISINRLSNYIREPDKFIGLHFMNPPQVIKLVEIISHKNTSTETLNTIESFIRKLNMTSVRGNDSPGFIVNRILIPMINEAVYCLEENLSDIESIDKAMRLGANHPMGPLRLADYIGLDTCLYILRVLEKDLSNPSYKPCPLLENYVKLGKLGKKTGEGFYRY